MYEELVKQVEEFRDCDLKRMEKKTGNSLSRGAARTLNCSTRSAPLRGNTFFSWQMALMICRQMR